MKKDRLPIGTVVTVKAQAKKVDLTSCLFAPGAPLQGVKWSIGVDREDCPYKTGIIVGGTFIQEGELSHEYEGVVWKAVKQHFVYLVRPAYLMKPIKVFPDDLEVDNGLHMMHNEYLSRKESPIPYSGSRFQWNEAARRGQAEIMAEVERDERGRWK